MAERSPQRHASERRADLILKGPSEGSSYSSLSSGGPFRIGTRVRLIHRTPPGHAGGMQWHWGNIGPAVAGLAALVAAVAAVYGLVRYGPAWLRDSRERQQAQAAAAREQEGPPSSC